jgi:hypothetical protein
MIRMRRNTVQIGPGFLGILTIVFITLKLTDHIDWSWIWVLAPMWIPIAVFVLFLGIVAVFAVLKTRR